MLTLDLLHARYLAFALAALVAGLVADLFTGLVCLALLCSVTLFGHFEEALCRSHHVRPQLLVLVPDVKRVVGHVLAHDAVLLELVDVGEVVLGHISALPFPFHVVGPEFLRHVLALNRVEVFLSPAFVHLVILQ